jgi:hypothetical protein
MAKILNLKDTNYKVPEGAVYVGRAMPQYKLKESKWANPFKIGKEYQGKVLTRELAIEAFENWLLYSDKGIELLKDIGELKDKDLICWCSPSLCHADILLREASKSENVTTVTVEDFTSDLYDMVEEESLESSLQELKKQADFIQLRIQDRIDREFDNPDAKTFILAESSGAKKDAWIKKLRLLGELGVQVETLGMRFEKIMGLLSILNENENEESE